MTDSWAGSWSVWFLNKDDVMGSIPLQIQTTGSIPSLQRPSTKGSCLDGKIQIYHHLLENSARCIWRFTWGVCLVFSSIWEMIGKGASCSQLGSLSQCWVGCKGSCFVVLKTTALWHYGQACAAIWLTGINGQACYFLSVSTAKLHSIHLHFWSWEEKLVAGENFLQWERFKYYFPCQNKQSKLFLWEISEPCLFPITCTSL